MLLPIFFGETVLATLIERYEILLANCHGDTLNFYRQNVSPGGKQTL